MTMMTGPERAAGGESNPLCEIRIHVLEHLPRCDGTGGRGGSRESCQWAALHRHTAAFPPPSQTDRTNCARPYS